MSQIKRISFALGVTLKVVVAMFIYFRIAVDEFQPMINGQYSGPFTSEANLAFWVVPIALSIILVATWTWVIISPQQEETKRARASGGPPR